MHRGAGALRYRVPTIDHGAPAEYAFASVPSPSDTGWMPAPNDDSIEYSIRSPICDAPFACSEGGDFTYFRATVCQPTATAFRSLVLGIGMVDDGARVTIVNSRFPVGITPTTAFATLFSGAFVSSDLAPLFVAGERNTVLLTHVDDCCQQSLLQGVTLRADGVSLPIGVVSESCNGIDDDCNGTIDDGLGEVTCGVGNCERTMQRCRGGRFVECAPGEPMLEVCDSFDNDCDGAIDEGLGMTECGTGACHNVVPNCARGFPVACTPGPPRVEACNGIDDDCDGVIDDDCRDIGPEPVLDAATDVADAIDATCADGARCDPRSLLLEGRAGPLGCACGVAKNATAGHATIGWFALSVWMAVRRRRREH